MYSAFATAAAVYGLSFMTSMVSVCGFIIGKTVTSASEKIFFNTITRKSISGHNNNNNNNTYAEYIEKDSYKYVLMELDIDNKINGAKCLIEIVSNNYDIFDLNTSDKYIKFCVKSLIEIIFELLDCSSKIHSKINEHSSKWFNQYYQPSIETDFNMLIALIKVFDSRHEALTKSTAHCNFDNISQYKDYITFDSICKKLDVKRKEKKIEENMNMDDGIVTKTYYCNDITYM